VRAVLLHRWATKRIPELASAPVSAERAQGSHDGQTPCDLDRAAPGAATVAMAVGALTTMQVGDEEGGSNSPS